MITLSDNRYIMVDVGVQGTYRDITNFENLGYVWDNPANLEYSKIILLNLNGSERTCAVITTDKKIHFGEFDGTNIICDGYEGDSAVLDEDFDISEYLK